MNKMTNEIKKRILLIDDDIDFIEIMKPQLISSGFEVAEANSKQEALDLLVSFKPDIVITDLMMENYDTGFEISYHIKKHDESIPVILITNVTQEIGMKFFPSNENERKWIKADLILNKPIRIGQLIKEIHKQLKM